MNKIEALDFAIRKVRRSRADAEANLTPHVKALVRQRIELDLAAHAAALALLQELRDNLAGLAEQGLDELGELGEVFSNHG